MSNGNGVRSSLFVPAVVEDHTTIIKQQQEGLLSWFGNIWPRPRSVGTTHLGYFQPDSNLYRDIYKRDRRSAKELEYAHTSGTWIEQGITCLEVAKESSDPSEQACLIQLGLESVRAAKERLNAPVGGPLASGTRSAASVPPTVPSSAGSALAAHFAPGACICRAPGPYPRLIRAPGSAPNTAVPTRFPEVSVAVHRDIAGPAHEALIAQVRTSGASRVDARTVALMGMQLEPSTWKGRATHLRTI